MIILLQAKWSKPFVEYYNNEIHPDVCNSIGRWILEKLHVYNPYSGVTTNQSEGYNTVMKRLQQWKEVPLHCKKFCVHVTQKFA